MKAFFYDDRMGFGVSRFNRPGRFSDVLGPSIQPLLPGKEPASLNLFPFYGSAFVLSCRPAPGPLSLQGSRHRLPFTPDRPTAPDRATAAEKPGKQTATLASCLKSLDDLPPGLFLLGSSSLLELPQERVSR